MKTIIAEKDEMERLAAEELRELITGKPDAVLALSVGDSLRGVYEKLRRLCEAGKLSLKDVRILAVTEYVGKGEGNCRKLLEESLLRGTDIQGENCHYPNGDDCAAYDELIKSLGIDAAVLGLGNNAHIGYNEPATPFDSYTHVQKLTGRTQRQLATRSYVGDEPPNYAVTVGIKQLTEAGRILLVAQGEEKADPVFQTVYGKTISYIPASFLQIPSEVNLYLDPKAASKL